MYCIHYINTLDIYLQNKFLIIIIYFIFCNIIIAQRIKYPYNKKKKVNKIKYLVNFHGI